MTTDAFDIGIANLQCHTTIGQIDPSKDALTPIAFSSILTPVESLLSLPRDTLNSQHNSLTSCEGGL